MKKLSLILIKFYQGWLSKFLPSSCRFTPTCSQYTYEAIERYGTITGIKLGLKRLGRCHPFHPGGIDNLP